MDKKEIYVQKTSSKPCAFGNKTKDLVANEEIKIKAVPFPDEYATKLQENYRAFSGQIASQEPELPKI